MFHYKDGLYFERKEDGTVRVVKTKNLAEMPTSESDPDIIFQFLVDADSWASIVASVSKSGEADGRFYIAGEFHNA